MEMGAHQSPLELYGRYLAEMFLASRLVLEAKVKRWIKAQGARTSASIQDAACGCKAADRQVCTTASFRYKLMH